MSFDARSRERLEALGRQLPRKLPLPVPAQPPSAAGGPASATGRHRVETEQDPERLFRELMDVSPDGTVPPHLLERLRGLESRRPAAAPDVPSEAGGPARGASPQPIRHAAGRRAPVRRAPAGSAEGEMYTAFEHLLLEEDDTDGPR